jgi:Flp pilus assembly protein TadD
MSRGIVIVAVLAVAMAGGCGGRQARPPEYQTLAEDPNRDTEAARRENARAAALLEEGRLDEAERALKDALAADLFFGPAHNNLGVVYRRQEKFYLAAWEFQYAAKLMPHAPEPRNNLGLVYEAVGRLQEAEGWYDKAIALQPDNPELVGNLARLRLRSGRTDAQTRRLLEDLALKDTRPDWAAWARERLALMGQEEDAQATTTKETPGEGVMPAGP